MPSLNWYFNRLRTMSVPEVGFRVQRAVSATLEKRGFGLVRETPLADPQRILTATASMGDDIQLQIEPYIASADKILSGQINFFSLHQYEHGPDINWNQDPMTGTVAPLSFGKTLDHRNPDLVGDIKYLWEPNRHLHLVTVAQAYKLTGERKYIEFIISSIRSWIEQCRYMLGPNWNSSLELGIRLINWSLVWRIVGGEKTFLEQTDGDHHFISLWFKSIYQHCHFISSHFSGHSSAGNHLIGEAAGLYCATSVWNFWPSCDSWRARAKSILIKESINQVFDDGVTKEQTTAYQQFVVDFLLFSGLLGNQLDDSFPPEYWKRIHKMIRFLAAIMDAKHHIPMIGDADDGFVSCLSQEPDFCPFSSLITTGAALFDDPYLKLKSTSFDHKSYWLLGEKGFNKYNKVSDPPFDKTDSFPDGGYYILGSELDTSREIRILVDTGPLGLHPLAAHGHADSLSLLLNVAGTEVLVDPGTYAYHTKRNMRYYFRGTSAHNTVRVDGQDQSVQGGTFMWSRHAVTQVINQESSPDKECISAEHDGYSRLPDPATHQRTVSYDKHEHRIHITDQIKSECSHDIELFWHLSEHCKVHLSGREAHIETPDAEVIIKCLDEAAIADVVYGDEETPLGWISRSFDVKVPTHTLVFRTKSHTDRPVETIIDINYQQIPS